MSEFEPDREVYEEGEGRRDYFWVVIVLGIVVVTVGALYTGSYLAKVFLNRDTTTVVTDVDEVSEEYDEESADSETLDRVERLEGAAPKPIKTAPVPAEDTKNSRNENTAAAQNSPAANESGKTKPDSRNKEHTPEEEPAEAIEDISIVTKSVIEAPEEKLYQEQQSKTSSGNAENESVQNSTGYTPGEESAAQTEQAPDKPTTSTPGNETRREETAQDDSVKSQENSEDLIYVLQLGHFKDEENALRFKEKVEAEVGLEVYVAKVDVDGEERYRVQVGAFSDKKNAQKLGREIQVLGYSYYINAQER